MTLTEHRLLSTPETPARSPLLAAVVTAVATVLISVAPFVVMYR